MINSTASTMIPENYDPEAPVVYDPALDGDVESDSNPDANRALADHIAALMEMVTVMVSNHEGTTTCVATVYLPNGYELATETSTCYDVDSFDIEVGKKLAARRALDKAENRLWDLEGYRMMTMMSSAPAARAVGE